MQGSSITVAEECDRIFGKLNTRNNGQFRLRIENPLSEQIEQEDEENAEKAPFCEIARGAAKKDADGFQCGGELSQMAMERNPRRSVAITFQFVRNIKKSNPIV